MIRPANLLRLFAGPIRARPVQTAPTALLARRFLETQTTSPAPTPQPPINISSSETSPSSASASEASTTESRFSPSSKSSQSPSSSSTLPSSSPSPARTRPALPYYVGRTASNELAVYHLAKRGGNKKLTTVKKVEGDRAKFRAALAAALHLKEKEVVINSVTGHIIVPGHRKAEVQKWLADQGF
ncbi:hypothetical protein VTJ04DRAFT_5706 [Mycothermus thermophilus]|uniref:mitochondrial 54S ribosomal protein mL49 n=1 Tax=Humicola insolens TaxID=85995 RepID=UPI003743B605